MANFRAGVAPPAIFDASGWMFFGLALLSLAIPIVGALLSMWIIVGAVRRQRYLVAIAFLPIAIIAIGSALILLTPYPGIEAVNPG